MRSRLTIILALVIVFIVDLIIAAVINYAIAYIKLTIVNHIPNATDISIANIIHYCLLLKTNYFIITVCLFVISLLWLNIIHKPKIKSNKQVITVNAKDSIYGASNWLWNEHTNEGQQKDFNLVYQANFQVPSFLIRSAIVDEKVIFNGIEATKIVNTITIGSTGSGKTKRDVEPTIIANCMLEDEISIVVEEIKNKRGKVIKTVRQTKKYNKPSFVVTDTKGELYHSVRDVLKNNNYEIYKIDFKNPEISMSWNIMWPIINYYELYVNYEKNNIEKKEFLEINYAKNFLQKYKCYLHNKSICDLCFEEIDDEQIVIWVDNYHHTWFSNKKELEDNCQQYAKIFRQKAIDEVEIIVATLIVATDEYTNRSWFIGAQNLLKGAIYAYLEVYEQDNEGFDLKWFNIFNIVNSILNKEKFCLWIKEHYEHYPNSMAWLTCGNIITTESKTRDQYFSILSTQVAVFLQESLQNILCENTINIFNFDSKEKPKALFIVMPEEENSKERIISLLLEQLYRALYYIADRNQNFALVRTTMFLIDEFANIAKIKNLDVLLNTARSRKICTSLIVQDLEQIENRYGGQAKAIRAACLLIKYLKSISLKTNQQIVQYCGQKTINKSSLVFSADYKPNYHLEAKNLLEPSQIMEYANNNVIVINIDHKPSVVKLLNVWQFYHLIKQQHYDWELKRNYINFDKDYRANIFDIYNEIATRNASNDLQKALLNMDRTQKITEAELGKKLIKDRIIQYIMRCGYIFQYMT